MWLKLGKLELTKSLFSISVLPYKIAIE